MSVDPIARKIAESLNLDDETIDQMIESATRLQDLLIRKEVELFIEEATSAGQGEVPVSRDQGGGSETVRGDQRAVC